MIIYLDSSCLVKIYVLEPGTHLIIEQIARAEIITSSLLAYPEMRAAFARRKREGVLSSQNHQRILARLEKDWEDLSIIPVSEALCEQAGELAESRGLRALDAIHLASALSLKNASRGTKVIFMSADQKLNTAALKEGFKDVYDYGKESV